MGDRKSGGRSRLIITLGGDGTILKTIRLLPKNKKNLLLAVNMGNLGVLTELPPEKIWAGLDKILAGRYFLDNRFLLHVSVYRQGKKVLTSLALNEVVINQGCFARLITLKLEVNQRKVIQFLADGLIISTPTGSTGHSLSAGGPIVHPSVPGLLINPICPVQLSNRPIILPNNRQLKITLDRPNLRKQSTAQAGLTLDGQVVFSLQDGDEIKIKKSKRKLYLIRLKPSGYYRMLRNKLGWGGKR